MKNLFAFTAARGRPFPEYVSVNEVDGRVRLTVRSPATADGNEGATGAVDLPPEQLEALALALRNHVWK